MICDIDYFKLINDTYGHQIGDLVLQALSGKVSETIRDADVLARYGGEEFVMVMPQTDRKGAMNLAERLRLAVESMEIPAHDELLKITISIGVATCQPATDRITAAEFIDRADKALYKAKRTGRNRVLEFKLS